MDKKNGYRANESRWIRKGEVLFFLFTTTLPLWGVFIECSRINPFLQIEQYQYYDNIFPFVFLILFGRLLMSGSYKQKLFFFSAPDIIFVSYLVIVFFSYNWSLNPAPERLSFLLQIGGMWFFLRVIVRLYPGFVFYWQIVMVLLATLQAIIGFLQLHGYHANHFLYSMTGSFFNSGPYGGYLAVIFPIGVYLVLHFRSPASRQTYYQKTIYYLACISLFLITALLPAVMSRTALIAATVSGIWVIFFKLNGYYKIRKLWKSYKSYVIGGGIIISLLLGLLSILLWTIKKDSANGRLFLWKMDIYTWWENKWGVGIGGFPAAYGEVQANYFANSAYSTIEKQIAGAPIYAFNEYLQTLIEHSIWGCLLLSNLIVYLLYAGVKNRQTGYTGALIALLIFSFASYPMQLPVFVVLSFFIAVGCVTPSDGWAENDSSGNRLLPPKLLIKWGSVFFIFISIGISFIHWNRKNTYEKWNSIQVLHQQKAYNEAVEKYDELYGELNHHPDFLFEFGQSLANTGKPEKAILILERGTKLSADPMFWNVMGRCYQQLKQYDDAERCYYRSIQMLPDRVYPYYLLTKLYIENENKNENEVKKIADMLLTMTPKINSVAVEEMKNEIRELVKRNRKNEHFVFPENE